MKILKVKIRVLAAWNNHGGWGSQAGYPKKEIGNCNREALQMRLCQLSCFARAVIIAGGFTCFAKSK